VAMKIQRIFAHHKIELGERIMRDLLSRITSTMAYIAGRLRRLVSPRRTGRKLSQQYPIESSTRTGSEERHIVRLHTGEDEITGTLVIKGKTWHLHLPEDEIVFTPPNPYYPAREYFGDEALKQFIAEELAPRGMTIHVCGTCAYFRFSGMSWDMSNGWVGYCFYHAQGALDPSKDTVDILHWCPDWKARSKT